MESSIENSKNIINLNENKTSNCLIISFEVLNNKNNISNQIYNKCHFIKTFSEKYLFNVKNILNSILARELLFSEQCFNLNLNNISNITTTTIKPISTSFSNTTKPMKIFSYIVNMTIDAEFRQSLNNNKSRDYYNLEYNIRKYVSLLFFYLYLHYLSTKIKCLICINYKYHFKNLYIYLLFLFFLTNIYIK